MQKSNKSGRSSFFTKKPQSLYKFIKSAGDKVFEAHPFGLLTSKKNKNYAERIVKECGGSEGAISKIIIDSFEPDVITLELTGKQHEVSKQGEAVFKGYTKAIEALEKVASQEVIADDKLYSGTRIGKTNISLREAIMDDVKDLKKRRAAWASLFIVHPELKTEPMPRTVRRMIENQAFCLFQYIDKCFRDTGKPIMAKDVHAFISELFKAIYNHPLFNAHVKFTPTKIKEYYDNGKRDRRMKKSSLRKSLEQLRSVKLD